MGAVVVLCHSFTDYPLRTPSLMTVTAVLAGIAVSASTRRGQIDVPAGRHSKGPGIHGGKGTGGDLMAEGYQYQLGD